MVTGICKPNKTEALFSFLSFSFFSELNSNVNCKTQHFKELSSSVEPPTPARAVPHRTAVGRGILNVSACPSPLYFTT